MSRIIEQVLSLDDETKLQFCREIFNSRFFDEFCQNMCYKHADIWREMIDEQLKSSDIREEDLENFFN